MQTKITIRNEAQTCYIDIEGTIGVPEESQFEDATSRVATFEAFRREVKRITEVKASSIVVNIRSTGGDVNDALLIYDALRALDAHITTRCYGYTASAATIIAQAADEGSREISANALYLIHNSTCAIEGNSTSLEARTELLRKTDEQLARLYALHSGKDEAFFAELMAENNGEGRWLSAEETIEAGLADAIIDYDEEVEYYDESEVFTEEQPTEPATDESANEPSGTGSLPTDKSSDESKPAKSPRRGKRGGHHTSETAWGSIIRFLLNRLAIRIDEWIESLQEKRKQKQEQESTTDKESSKEKSRKKRGNKGKENDSAQQENKPSQEQPTTEQEPATQPEKGNAGETEVTPAEESLPKASASTQSALFFTERQRLYAATQLQSIEDPSMGDVQLGSNAQAYAEDVKVFDR